MIFRFLTSGESHGKCLNAIIEGVPAGIRINEDFINNELKRRQAGYGRGGRMSIETDKVKILSGVRLGKSIGSPICLEITNKDWENWTVSMSSSDVKKTDENLSLIESVKIKNARPGHADLAGAIKYDHEDIRNILERSSARETAMRVAVGAIAKCILKEFDMDGISYVKQIGSVKSNLAVNPFEVLSELEYNDLRVADKNIYQEMKDLIDKAKEEGDTLGGSFEVRFRNIPIGLGSHVHWDRKLDGLIAQAVMSIQAVKSVEIGLGKEVAERSGFNTHDEIFSENNKYIRKTNNAGGIEGGISNGEDIIVNASMKAIPTMRKPLNSVQIDTKENVEAHFERSDTCAVSACAVVAESMVAIVLADEMLEKFSHDSLNEMKTNYNNYMARVAQR